MARDIERKPTKIKTASQKALDIAITKAINDALADIGVERFTCHLCGELLDKSEFYKNTDPQSKTKVAPICKNCSDKIVYTMSPDGTKHNPTKESIQEVLRYLDKPWFEKVYEDSLQEAANQMSGRVKTNVWNAYIKNIQMKQYVGKRWKDGDIEDNLLNYDIREVSNSEEIKQMYEINRRTVVSALGYDPFESASDADKPLMYSKLVGFMDESTNDDEFKLGACIEITHAMNQAERINFVINDLQKTPASIIQNCTTIKSLEDTKNKIFNSALALAKDNGISIKHSNQNTKGANQWTGKVKELKEMNLREQEVNAFEVGISEGMQQVAQASIAAIFKQLDLDENDYTDMIKTQREMIENLQSKLEAATEESRIFRRENKDLKDFLKEKGMIDERDEVVV